MAQSDSPDIQIEDEEEYVAKRVKQRILDSRQQVDDMEQALFDEELLMPDVQLPHGQKVVAWGNTVRRFIRNIEVILHRLDIPQADKFLSNIKLGEVELVPPDDHGYQFSKIAHPDLDDGDVKRLLGLPPSTDLPQPRTETFHGLQSIVETDPVLVETWYVSLGDGTPDSRDVLELTRQQPLPKAIYEDAVRAADRFLHDAGIGLDIKAEDWHSEEPGL